jgi:hypothetical protein
MKGKRVVIHDRRFMWWDGKKLTPIRLSERARAHLSQVKSVAARENPVPEDFEIFAGRSNKELGELYGVGREKVQKWREATGLHRPMGGGPRLLPAKGQYDESMSLSELARVCGWESPCRFSTALRKYRPEIHARAVENGRARSKAALRQMKKDKGE